MGVVKSDLNKLLREGTKVMPKILDECVSKLMADPKFKPKDPKMSKKSAAFAVCTASLKKAGKLSDPLYIFPHKDSKIELVGLNKFKKQILRFGKWIHPHAPGGVLKIAKPLAKKLVDNFKKNVIENVFVAYTHSDDPRDSAGNVIEMTIKKDGVYATIEVDGKAAKLISKGKLKGISASIDPEYQDKESGKMAGPVIRHVALVMEPYIKGLKPYQELSLADGEERELNLFKFKQKGGEETVTVKKKKKVLLKDKKKSPKSTPAKAAAKDTGKVKLVDKVTKKKVTKLEDKVENLESQLRNEKAIKLVDGWLSKGKIVPAQKEAAVALLSSSLPTASGIKLTDAKTKKEVKLSAIKAFKLFVKNSPKIELDEKGKTTTKGKEGEITSKVKEQLEMLGLTEEDHKKFGGEKTPAEIAQMLSGEKGVGTKKIIKKE